MNPFRGTGTVVIDGVSRPIKFSTNQAAVYCSLQRQPFSLDDYFSAISPFKLNVRDLLYSCLYDGAIANKRPINFDVYAVGDWIDEKMTSAQFAEAFGAMLTAMTQSLPKPEPEKEPTTEEGDKKKGE